MDLKPDMIHESRGIYLAELEALLRIVRNLPDSMQRAMIVGHNPGLEELLATLSEMGVSPFDDNGRLQTCALVVLRLPDRWANIAPQSAALLHLIRPRELPQSSES
jgi:phosphohistidine phosphatase